jgi:hypothetical protein
VRKTVIDVIMGAPFNEKYQLVQTLGKSNFKSTDLQEIHSRLFGSTLDRSLGKPELFNELLFSIQNYCKTVEVYERYWALPRDKSILHLPNTVKLDQVQKRRITG